MRTIGVTALERLVANHFSIGGLNQVIGCTNLTLAPTGSQEQLTKRNQKPIITKLQAFC
jgi:hypothetical protein